MIDIDHFKIVNDTYGHSVGDEVLKKLVATIKEKSRHNDNIIRWGGEEFMLILSTKSFETLEKTLKNICNIIRETKFEVCNKITISIGASIYKDNEVIEETIKRADEALYFSKRNGRDQIKIVK
jgi:diguanylate cyclase (GGDEF)-like protein